ncbi:MAG TPA: amidohydrolase family protein [Flavisolibacter sp.]|jgi:L-fuconolactonase|nr:amidohydrolase family protein [Flavisolibacter sp.]
MRIIDAHQHFWKFDPVKDAWITDEMKILQRDFLPQDLEPVLQKHAVEGCVAVQAEQSETETHFLLKLAKVNGFIKAVVGWVDLQAGNIEDRLDYFSQFKMLKGFRHILQGEARRDLMLAPAFKKGISLLQKYNFTYDILIYPDQLRYTTTLVSEFPNQKFIIDHLAKPAIKGGEITEWKKELAAVAQHENVWCKVSGLVTEADWASWQKDDFKPYMDAVVELFGTHRLLFGSDWPVCLLAAAYEDVLLIVKDYFSFYSETEKEKIFADNAIQFYNI